MSLRNDVYAALRSNSPVPRVYPDQAPQGAGYPLLTYSFVAGHDEVHLDGYSANGRRVVQVDAWASDPDVADSMIADAKASLGASTAFTVNGVTENGATGFDNEAKMYRASRDFVLWFTA